MAEERKRLYAERDIWALDKDGGHYCRHVEAMTAEGLHSKSDIAAELAHRDWLLERARRLLHEALEHSAGALSGRIQELLEESE